MNPLYPLGTKDMPPRHQELFRYLPQKGAGKGEEEEGSEEGKKGGRRKRGKERKKEKHWKI